MTCKKQKAVARSSHWKVIGLLCGASIAVQAVADELHDPLPPATIIEPGKSEVVDQATGLEYELRPESTLTVGKNAVINGATVERATLNFEGGKVFHTQEIAKSGAAITINSGTVNATGAAITSTLTPGVVLSALVYGSNLTPSRGTFNDSTVEGRGYGIRVGGSELFLIDSDVMGNQNAQGIGVGLQASGSKVEIKQRSTIKGASVGLQVANQGLRPGDGTPSLPSSIMIDDSAVSGLSGAAISVTGNVRGGANATIDVRNNSELSGGNGNLLEVHDLSKVVLKIDDSRLSGNLFAEDGSTLDVTLRNAARLSGNTVNVNNMTLRSDAQWQMLGDNTVQNLTLTNSRVSYAGDGFNTLSLGKLSGHGTFDMRINLDTGEGDLLSVNGEASGNHLLNIQNTGAEAVTPEVEPLRVVHTEGGDAVFGLVGSRVDLGTYSYELEKQDTDWFVVGSGKIISPSTQSVLALFNAAPTIWNSELTTLRSRMGEVRGQEQGGGWIRAYGNRFTASLDSGVDYRQKQQGMSFGADAPVPVADGRLLLGLMGGYSHSDLDLSRGTSGTVKSYYVGAYGTWLSEQGYYVDAVLKLNQMHNRSRVAMSDGAKAKGDYNNSALGGSVELGKHIKLADDWFVEPYTQLSTVWVEGNSYSLDNGMQARTDATRSVLGKLGTTAGRNFALKDGGTVQPYVRVAMAHEFARNNEVKVNGNRFDNDLFGSRVEVGAGVAVSLSERLQLHADVDYMKGEHVQQPWGANVGLRLAF